MCYKLRIFSWPQRSCHQWAGHPQISSQSLVRIMHLTDWALLFLHPALLDLTVTMTSEIWCRWINLVKLHVVLYLPHGSSPCPPPICPNLRWHPNPKKKLDVSYIVSHFFSQLLDRAQYCSRSRRPMCFSSHKCYFGWRPVSSQPVLSRSIRNSTEGQLADPGSGRSMSG